MLLPEKYILVGKRPVPEPDLVKWAQWYERAENRVVKQTKLGEATVSTIFLGIDHRCSGDGPPLLFETMVFGGEHDGWQERYATWEEAEAGHERAVKMVRETAPGGAENGLRTLRAVA
ncbi:MAG: hypothetical protein JRI59_10740 [Deltaproteobacteria bacterium]|nr:hypothetical protein [Deltaproteobacteria bacterium]